MGYFTLSGSHEKLAPLAGQMGLLFERINGENARWGKRFTPSRRKVSAPQSGSAKPMRPYDRGQENDKSKAIEYASWLAKRDGVDIEGFTFTHVNFVDVEQEGFKSLVRRTHSVVFYRRRLARPIAEIKIPHTHYDPSRMPSEMINE